MFVIDFSVYVGFKPEDAASKQERLRDVHQRARGYISVHEVREECKDDAADDEQHRTCVLYLNSSIHSLRR